MASSTTKEPILPQDGKRNVLVTSALPYVNNVPHLGNIIGSVLSADVFARWSKARGHPTLFVCGSDEYGTATETKALEEGVTPEELCRKYHKIHKDIYDWFDLDFDIFGRTPTNQQTEIVQDIFSKLWKNGFIEERETTQPFCPAHGSFLADRYVEGECSLCGYPDARGDQCDKCGSLLDPLEPEPETNKQTGQEEDAAPKSTGWLINPRCKLEGATPEKRRTKHLFLRLDDLRDEIVSWFHGASKEWSSNCVQITQSWIDKGLKPRGITRDLKWGVPIPTGLEGLSDEDYGSKVFYVWFDACIGYVSITKNYTDGDDLAGKKWEKWWKNPENVSLYQFMGKDNVPFHSIVFPAGQLGTKENWTMLNRMSTTEYLNYEGGKFSKSRGVGVFGNSAKDTGIHSNIWRYYLLSRRPETNDSEFKWQEFVDANNNDLLKNLGNFNQRVIKFCNAKMDSVVPDYTKYSGEHAGYFENHKHEVDVLLKKYNAAMEATKLRSGLEVVLAISALGNKLLQDNKLDNRLFTEEPERCAAVIGTALNHIHLVANILSPYMPSISQSMLEMLGASSSSSSTSPHIPETFAGDALKPGHKIAEAKLLFSQIPATKVEEWREAFGGEEVKKQKEEAAAKAAAKKAQKEKEKEKKRLKKEKERAEKDGGSAGAEGKSAKTASSGGPSVEAGEKRVEADPAVEGVTQAMANTEVHTS